MEDSDRSRRIRTPLFPLYSEVRALLPVWAGVPKGKVWKLIKEIWDHTGTPQNPVDWSDPDKWIGERLSREHQELARRIWEETGRAVNPRHTYGSYLFIYGYNLLAADPVGQYHLTERGERFLREDGNAGGLVFILDLRRPLVCLLLVFVLKPGRHQTPIQTEAKRSEMGVGSPKLHDFVEACARALSKPRTVDPSPACADTALCEQAKRRLSLCTPGGVLCL